MGWGLWTRALGTGPGSVGLPDPEVQAFAHRAVSVPMLDISSTAIRDDAAAAQDITQLVPPAVARSIESHGLYQKHQAGSPSPIRS